MRQRFEPKEYANEQLMDDLNEFMIAIKVHLFDLPVKRSKPTIKEIDQLTIRLMHELKKDATNLIKRSW